MAYNSSQNDFDTTFRNVVRNARTADDVQSAVAEAVRSAPLLQQMAFHQNRAHYDFAMQREENIRKYGGWR